MITAKPLTEPASTAETIILTVHCGATFTATIEHGERYAREVLADAFDKHLNNKRKPCVVCGAEQAARKTEGDNDVTAAEGVRTLADQKRAWDSYTAGLRAAFETAMYPEG